MNFQRYGDPNKASVVDAALLLFLPNTGRWRCELRPDLVFVDRELRVVLNEVLKEIGKVSDGILGGACAIVFVRFAFNISLRNFE